MTAAGLNLPAGHGLSNQARYSQKRDNALSVARKKRVRG